MRCFQRLICEVSTFPLKFRFASEDSETLALVVVGAEATKLLERTA